VSNAWLKTILQKFQDCSEDYYLVQIASGHTTKIDIDDFEKYKGICWYALKGTSDVFYMHTRYNGKTIGLHRLIMDAPKGLYVDHINRDPMDNRKKNLRICTPSQNQGNRKPTGDNRKYKGIFWYKNRWVASIYKNNKSNYIGRYKTPEEAALAYNKAAIEHFGEFALLNIIGEAQ
jgi:hypothetical protein